MTADLKDRHIFFLVLSWSDKYIRADDIYNSSFCIKRLIFICSFYWTKSRDRILLLALKLNVIKYLTLLLKQDNTSMNLLFPLHTSDITTWMINTSTVKIMGATEAAFEDLLFSIMWQLCFKRRFICIFLVLDKTNRLALRDECNQTLRKSLCVPSWTMCLWLAWSAKLLIKTLHNNITRFWLNTWFCAW